MNTHQQTPPPLVPKTPKYIYTHTIAKSSPQSWSSLIINRSPLSLSLSLSSLKLKKLREGFMEYCTDEKWKPSKDDLGSYASSSYSSSSSLMRSISQKSSTSKSPLLRNSSFKSILSRSSSQKSSSSKPTLSRSSSHKGSDFARKCSSLAKEQRARFYIMKRCVKMLICWKKNSDS